MGKVSYISLGLISFPLPFMFFIMIRPQWRIYVNPSEIWLNTTWWIISIIVLLMPPLMLWLHETGRIIAVNTSVRMARFFLFRVFGCYIIACGLGFGLFFPLRYLVPEVANRWVGEPWSEVGSYQVTYHSYSRSRTGKPRCQSRLNSEVMDTSFYGALCISEATSRMIPEQGMATFYGTDTWFGSRVESFRVHKE